jgi:murein DD-endopeptidase MepM/ murein hydrolase activator NlpD
MVDELEHTPPDDLEARLRAEEPPIEADDTSPSRALKTEVLRIEEPPISADDTSPSIVSRQSLSDNWPPHAPRKSSVFQRALALVMLFGAVMLTALATYVWLDSEETDPAPAPDQPIAQNVTPDAPDPTHAPDSTAPPAPPQINDPAADPSTPSMYWVFPTAAADEIAAALLTPVPADPFTDAIQRGAAPFTTHPNMARNGVIQYTVQPGDTLQTIAAKFDLADYYTLVWSNSSSKYGALRPGTQINILPEDGVYYEVSENLTIAALAEKYKVDPYAIIDAEYNNLFGSTPDTLLVKGMWIVIPGAEGERVNLLPANTQAGSSGGGSSGAVSGPYTLWGCSSNIGGGSPPFTRPLENYQWMQGFSLGGHEAVDLSSPIGMPVFAAGSGTVAFAGSNSTGYGNVIVIGHGDTFTIYGHLDSVGVRCGQSVTAGQQIGTSGNTGNSTGPHLHFEIRDGNWNPINPRNYIGF